MTFSLPGSREIEFLQRFSERLTRCELNIKMFQTFGDPPHKLIHRPHLNLPALTQEGKILQSNATKFSEQIMYPPGFEPGTFRVLGGCDNHYTMGTQER
ncbi:hypothetical protein TNCV_1283881 [Trichonephila clavipes]|uniref:Uncharacterized protein n=1 Tax=Trichonephila clavipes TaxID=2585209 RepID=A0A8X6VP36_TRICX|nr:hypothetical protein TNCV_1283881 [Trichonephila clavipes]